MRKLLLATFLFFGLASSAQNGRLAKANDLHAMVAYSEAAQIYTELIGSEVDTPTMKARLADCFYQMGNTLEAENYYASMITSTEAKSTDVYQYAQSLKENGKTAESDEWMKKFSEMNSKDSRGQRFLDNKMYFKQILSQDEYFDVDHMSINTKNVEFGGYPIGQGKVCFVSDRKNRFAVKKVHSWNDKKYLDFFTANLVQRDSVNPITSQVEIETEFTDIDMNARKDNSRYHEGPLCITPDNKMVYFTRNNVSKGINRRDYKGIQHLKIYRAEITESGKWKNEEEISLNSREYSVGHPAIASDGKTMYFVSDKPGGFGGADIYKTIINKDGSLSEPINLGKEVNTEGQDMFPWITSDDILFYSSDGHVGLGGLDVYAIMKDATGEFTQRINLGEPVNSSKDDFALVMTSKTTGFLSSNRESGSGDDDIYSIHQLKELVVQLMLKGIVTDERSTEELPKSIVYLFDDEGEIIDSAITDEEGKYIFELEPDKKYTVQVQKEEYYENTEPISTRNLPMGTSLVERDITLNKEAELMLYALITDARTGNPIENVKMVITDNMTDEKVEHTTPATGDYWRPLTDKRLNDRGSYNFILIREGYIPREVTYNELFSQEGRYNVHMKLDFTMDETVSDLGEMVQLNPINFDLDKWNIRADAKIELDKIVKILNKYPAMVIEHGSHTDCRASRSYNMKLSDRRAKSSAKYIKSKIVNPDRIYGKGYGESKLLNDCGCEGAEVSPCTEAQHQENRRTEFRVISAGDPKLKVLNNSTNSFEGEK